MRKLLMVLFVAMVGGAALAASAAPNVASKLAANPAPQSPVMPPLTRDDDRDGFPSSIDCNDDNPFVHPGATEIANGIDDDCNGIVDEGFDRSIDMPAAAPITLIWPSLDARGGRGSRAMIPLDASPRLLWAGTYFIAVWSDQTPLIRMARIQPDGTLLDNPPLRLRGPARNPDAVWTGTRLAIVYEDMNSDPTAVKLLTLDPILGDINDVVVAANGSQPKIAWGQDRFGIVWKTPFCAGDCLRFQRFDKDGNSLSAEETLPNSGQNAAITFSGTAVVPLSEGYAVHEGSFGIAYENNYGFKANGNVSLSSRPRDGWGTVPTTVQVNLHDDPSTTLGANPAIAASTDGFAVSWHVAETVGDRTCNRVFSRDTLAAVQEFMPDSDAGRIGRLVWTGSEFVTANDNVCGTNPPVYDIHVRRIDPSGNTHLAAGWGPYLELNLTSTTFPGGQSVRPDIAYTGSVLGVLWIVEDPTTPGSGRLFFTTVNHK